MSECDQEVVAMYEDTRAKGAALREDGGKNVIGSVGVEMRVGLADGEEGGGHVGRVGISYLASKSLRCGSHGLEPRGRRSQFGACVGLVALPSAEINSGVAQLELELPDVCFDLRLLAHRRRAPLERRAFGGQVRLALTGQCVELLFGDFESRLGGIAPALGVARCCFMSSELHSTSAYFDQQALVASPRTPAHGRRPLGRIEQPQVAYELAFALDRLFGLPDLGGSADARAAMLTGHAQRSTTQRTVFCPQPPLEAETHHVVELRTPRRGR